MVEGLIVAAGCSRRTGPHYKMSLDLGGQTLIERAVASMEPWCDRIIVVNGHQGDLIRSVLEANPKVDLVHNPGYQAGMFSSVKTGLPLIRAERFFFLPGDYPLVSPVVYEKMLAVAAETVIPVYEGQTGHPLLLSTALIDPIMAWPDSSNLGEFIRRQPASTVAVNCPGILIDIDTMEDYQRALTLIAAQGGC